MKPVGFAVLCVVLFLVTSIFAELLFGGRPKSVPDDKPPPELSGHVYGIREFTLSDGTRCVGAYNVGLTCDWKRP